MENKEKKFLKFEIRWWLLAVFIAIFWLFFPFLFKAFMFWIDLIGVEQKVFADFGAIGDIYGSLNTLISSIALCAVAYSTILQVKELRLARQTYTDQLNESKFSNFTANFYTLLNHKNMNYNNLSVQKKNGVLVDAQKIFSYITDDFVKLKDYGSKYSPTNKEKVKKDFSELLSLSFNPSPYMMLNSHFAFYSDLIFLIKKSDIDDEDKQFFFRLVRNSMTNQEQLCLLWFSSFDENLRKDLNKSGLIKIGYSKNLISFFTKFHDKSLFSDSELLREWEKLEAQKKTSA